VVGPETVSRDKRCKKCEHDTVDCLANLNSHLVSVAVRRICMYPCVRSNCNMIV
jgi:hypothetical protein